MFSIQPNFTIKDIENDFKQFEADIKADLVAAMVKTLHSVVDRARSRGMYNDISHNLRSSVGGLIVEGNKVLETYFPATGKGADGRAKGIAFANEVASLVNDGDITLVFVAGAEYAFYVEATDRDVITGSSRKIESELLTFLKQ